jgi:hypothetical protein
MESFRDDKLAATLSALRPAPRPAFTAELDERAAAGFPPQSSDGASRLSRLLARARAIPPRRVLLATGATALAALAVTTVLVASNESSPKELAYDNAVREPLPAASSLEAAPTPTQARPSAGPEKAGSAGGASTGDSNSFESVYESEVPTIEYGASSHSSASDGSGAVEAESGAIGGPAKIGPYASQARNRDIERSAEMVLGAEPAEVGDASAQVFEAVHAVDGVVLRSSTRGGSAGDAGARFDLLIPSARLSDALAAFSAIAEVRSRHEATNDITAPTIGLSERLQDSNAKIEGLLRQLAGSETEVEREAVEAELRAERSRAANLRSGLSNIQRKASFSRVSLRIETGDAPTPSESSGGWSIGDALHDAGRILGIAAGVAIVGLAILGPLALIALLIWLANRSWIRRSRQRALS